MKKLSACNSEFFAEPDFPGYRYIELSKHDADEYFATYNITVDITSDKTQKTFNLFRMWRTAANRLGYVDCIHCMVPPGSPTYLRMNEFNSFNGYRITKERAERSYHKSKNIGEMFEEYLRTLVGDDDSYKMVCVVLAFVLQYPDVLPGTMLYLRGEQGNGKSLLIWLLRTIMGECNVGSTAKADAITGDFNDELAGKKVMALEEAANGVFNPKAMEVVKDLITKATQTINTKYKSKYLVRLATLYIVCTNQDIVARVKGDGDRRGFVINTSDKWCEQKHRKAGTLDQQCQYFMRLRMAMKHSLDQESDNEFGAFVYWLYTYPLKTHPDGSPVLPGKYGIPCKGLCSFIFPV
jgi:hypothetical protein